LPSSRIDIQRTLVRAREYLAYARWHVRVSSSQLGQRLRAFKAEQRLVSTAARERLAYASWHVRESSSQLRHRLRAFSAEHRLVSTAARERLAYARWYVREISSQLGERLRAFRAGHRRASAVAALGLLLGLGLAGTGAAFLADDRTPDVINANYASRYVTVTGPGGGTRTYAVTVTKGSKQTVVRTHVVTGPGGVSTLRDTVAIPGPTQLAPGHTSTVAGPTKTVTVTGSGQTVTETDTQTVTEAVTETVTVINEVTVTETVPE
jgi:hypothetical protein